MAQDPEKSNLDGRLVALERFWFLADTSLFVDTVLNQSSVRRSVPSGGELRRYGAGKAVID